MVDARNRAAQSRRFGGGMNALPASPPASVPADLPLSVSRGIGMTARQLETLAYIDAYQQASGGVSPSFAEIRDRLGLEARSGVFRLVDALEERGHIRRLRHRARAIEVIDPQPVRSEEHTSALQSLMR